MARAVVGLDIGTTGVRAAEVSTGRSGPTLQRFGQVALPVGAVRDGEVVDVEAVADALKDLWSRARFGSKRVVVGVANQKVVVRQVELPWLAEAELRRSLAFQVQDHIPMPVEQAILDFHPLEEGTGEGGARTLKVMLVAASRDMVTTTLDAVTRAGLTPSVVDLNSFAVLRSMAHTHSWVPDACAEALVDVGASVTNIIVHQAGAPRFVRILLMGGADITDALSERLGVPLEQAEAVKRSTGMAAGQGEVDEHPAARAVESAGGALVEEVRGSLDYYLSQPGSLRIDRVVLSGGGSLLPGLEQRLSAATRLPVLLARPLAQLRIGKTGLSAEQLAEAETVVSVPLGLALGSAA